MSISYPNPTQPSQCIRAAIELVDGARTVGFWATGPVEHNYEMPSSGLAIWGPGLGSLGITGSLEHYLLDAINSAQEFYTGGTTGGAPNEVRIDEDGRVEVTINRTPAVAFKFRPNSSGGDMNPRIFGIDPDDPEFEFAASTGVYNFPYTVWPQWIPGVFNKRDTGNVTKFKVSESLSVSERPHYLEWADPITKRMIEWEAVAGSRIHTARAALSQFAASAQTVLGDPNVALEELIAFLISGSGTYPFAVYVFEDVTSGAQVLGPYHVHLKESQVMEGIKDEALLDGSGMEMFGVKFVLKVV